MTATSDAASTAAIIFSDKVQKDARRYTDGGVTALRAEDLPAGHVSITWFPYRGSDYTTSMHGPVVVETNDTIQLQVWGSIMSPMRKRDCIIVRAVS